MPAITASPASPDDSNYEANLRARRTDQNARQASRNVLNKHNGQVELAISLNRQASLLESQIREYDNPNSGFIERVRLAKLARNLIVATIATYAFIWLGDFWLATPDPAEALANKAMALTSSITGEKTEVTSEGIPITPVWLRLCVGAILTTGFLALTAWIKNRSDESPQRNEIRQLQPEDDIGFSQIRRVIWLKRGMKAGYMVVLAVLLNYLFTFDLERARIMEELRNQDQEAQEWESVEVRISNSGLETDEAIEGPPTGPATVEAGGKKLSFILATPSLLVYAMLWMLHGMLLITPSVKAGEDWELARFKRGSVGRQIEELRDREGQTLRGLVRRIREQEGEMRDALIIAAQPVRDRINTAFGTPVMAAADAVASQAAPPWAATPEQTQTPIPSDGTAGGPVADAGGNENQRPPRDDDPYGAIFPSQ